MPRAPKPCGHAGCPTLITARTYCDQHEAERQATLALQRGSTTQRGYDATHRTAATRAIGKARRDANNGQPQTCPRCHQPMLATQRLQYGHAIARAIDPTSRATRVEHATCNERAGARNG